MDSELLTRLFKFIEHFPDYLLALSRTIETGLFQLIKPFEPYTTIVYLRTPQKQKKCGIMLTS